MRTAWALAMALSVIGLISSIAFADVSMDVTGLEASKEQADPETDAWKKVDQMDITQLRGFLKSFPEGKYANDAEFALEMHQRVQDIRSGKARNATIISFESLGERWKYWCKAKPGRGAVGVYRYQTRDGQSGDGIFAVMGCFDISTDYSGTVMTPTGDGSILAVETAGLKFRYIGDIIFESETEGTLYFAVIKGKGLAHVCGNGGLTMPDGKLLKLTSQWKPTHQPSRSFHLALRYYVQ